MTNLTYNIGIPDGPHNPSNDQPLMKVNNDNNERWVKIDHKGYNVNQGGYHSVVHLVDNIVDPVAVPAGADPAAGEVYNKTVTEGVNTDTALFYQSGKGQIFQITGTQAPNPIANGYTFLPGGIRLMWGSVAIPGGGVAPVVFTPAFISTPFSVNVSVVGSGTRAVNIQVTTLSNTGFSVASLSGGITTAYWMAIGI